MSTALYWFRKDLRLADNPGLTAASAHERMILIYIYPQAEEMGAAQYYGLEHSLEQLSKDLQALGGNLHCLSGVPQTLIPSLVARYHVDAVYWNQCYEPKSWQQERALTKELQELGCLTKSFPDNLLNLEPALLLNQQQQPYRVFTPFYKALRFKFSAATCLSVPRLTHAVPLKLREASATEIGSPERRPLQLPTLGESSAHQKLHDFINHKLNHYKTKRDIPAANATSQLSPHLALGEISPRQIYHACSMIHHQTGVDIEPFIRQLVWREFSAYILFHFPHILTKNFNSKFDAFPWQSHSEFLMAWQQGVTGISLVDAGMRELGQTGMMHNRVRMVAASFLTKHLNIHWRVGEDWFWNALVDADKASNIVNWQWVAGCGVDAAPYFRIFNPFLQAKKFDPQGEYICRWVPEARKLPISQRLQTYTQPIIDIEEQRKAALENYKMLGKPLF